MKIDEVRVGQYYKNTYGQLLLVISIGKYVWGIAEQEMVVRTPLIEHHVSERTNWFTESSVPKTQRKVCVLVITSHGTHLDIIGARHIYSPYTREEARSLVSGMACDKENAELLDGIGNSETEAKRGIVDVVNQITGLQNTLSVWDSPYIGLVNSPVIGSMVMLWLKYQMAQENTSLGFDLESLMDDYTDLLKSQAHTKKIRDKANDTSQLLRKYNELFDQQIASGNAFIVEPVKASQEAA